MASSKLNQQGPENIKQKLYDQTIAIESILLKLGKADTLLSYWTEEYCYMEKPDPQAALTWGLNAAEETHYQQSAQWFMEYRNITQFIEIVYDYVYESKEALTRLLEETAVGC